MLYMLMFYAVCVTSVLQFITGALPDVLQQEVFSSLPGSPLQALSQIKVHVLFKGLIQALVLLGECC